MVKNFIVILEIIIGDEADGTNALSPDENVFESKLLELKDLGNYTTNNNILTFNTFDWLVFLYKIMHLMDQIISELNKFKK